jgi:gamma-glutamylcyclotransferase (GGCT)/AIG2-like uncharacterized protein YtfP
MKIFVYGTLKSGQPRNFYITRDDGKLLGRVKTAPKYRLFRQWFADYPSMVEDSNGVSVEGELWDVNDRTVRILDDVEGVSSSLFKRVPIELSDGSRVEGYIANKKPFPRWQLNSWD